MRRDRRAYLWDAVESANSALEFAEGKTFSDYEADRQLRRAVEREFTIIGEALNQLSKVDADLAARIPGLGKVVGFRNVVMHGYAEIDDALVWAVLQRDLAILVTNVQALLDEIDG